MNALRAADSRFHSTVSVARSARGAAFHSSRSWRIRSPLIFQWVASAAIRSASSTILVLRSCASLRACSRAALFSSRRWSTRPVRASSRPRSPSRSPTQFAQATDSSSRVIVDLACAGDRSVVLMRCSSRLTSVSSDKYLRWKKARASAGLPACHEPTTRSPSAVFT